MLYNYREMDAKPLQFIEEPVTPFFVEPPALEKTPHCPDRFTWRGQEFRVVELLGEWRDYQRRGRLSRNMRPEHAAAAARRGSWGVGLFYFRLRTEEGRIFDLYYDRAPQDVDRRKGGWYLFQELSDA